MRDNKTILLIFILLILSLSIFMGFNSIADDSTCEDIAGESVPGGAKDCKIRPLKFIEGIPDEIECGSPVTITITGGTSPFQWTVSGIGYTLTEVNEKQYSLSCSSGSTCGTEVSAVATVTVTDSCNDPISISLRNFIDNGAGWDYTGVQIGNGDWLDGIGCPSECNQTDTEIVVGNKRWTFIESCMRRDACSPTDTTGWGGYSNGNPVDPPCGTPCECYSSVSPDCANCTVDSCYGTFRQYNYYVWRCQ